MIAQARRHRALLVVGAPAVWAVALGISIAVDGLPVARDQLFFWLVLGMAAFSVAAWRSWGLMVLEWLPLFALLVGYDYLRGAVSPEPATAHVDPQIAVDRFLFAGRLPTVWLQQRLYDPVHVHWYDVAIWCVYLTHFFAVWIVAAVLWRVAHDRYRRYAALAVLVTLMAFLGYWLYPAQPPWLASDLGEIGHVQRIVPAVWGALGVPSAQSLFENGEGLVNLVAAMPSLHAAFPLMLLLFFWPAGRGARIGLGLYTLAMAFTLVYGGEHFVTDVLAGWLAAALAFAAVSGIGRLAARAPRASSPRRACR